MNTQKRNIWYIQKLGITKTTNIETIKTIKKWKKKLWRKEEIKKLTKVKITDNNQKKKMMLKLKIKM